MASKQKREFRIGSRKSKLALIQTKHAQKMLQERFPDYSFPILTMETLGDKVQNKPLYEIGGKALWTLELEQMLLAGHIDLIVHSLKDIRTELPDYAILGAILEREDSQDAVVMRSGSPYKSIQELAPKSVVATSSLRRAAHLKRAFPQLVFVDMASFFVFYLEADQLERETRLSKLDNPENNIDCLILATAGLLRLGLKCRITQILSSPILYGAVGQGALGIEIRKNDLETLEVVKTTNHENTFLACTAERSLLKTLEGGCSIPIGVESDILPNGNLQLEATVVAIDGSKAVTAKVDSLVTCHNSAIDLGEAVANKLVALGANQILESIVRSREAN